MLWLGSGVQQLRRLLRVAWRWIRCLLVLLVACSGGGGGGGNGGEAEPEPGTGADGVSIYWKTLGSGVGSATDIIQTSDGGFLLAGYQSEDFSLPSDGHLVKTGADGAVQWEKGFGGSERDHANAVCATSDGGYLAVGLGTSDACSACFSMIKLSSAGDTLPGWPKHFAGNSREGAYAVIEVGAGQPSAGYVIVGSDSLQQAMLLKTDTNGIEMWRRSYAGLTPGWDTGLDVEESDDHGLVIVGRDGAWPAPDAVLVIRTDANGNLLPDWPKAYGPGEACAVIKRPGGGFVLVGETPGAGGLADALVLAIRDDGSVLWRRTFGGVGLDDANDIVASVDGGFVIAGRTRSFSPPPPDPSQAFLQEDLFLIKLDASGNTLWQKVKGKAPKSSDGAQSISVVKGCGVADCGYVVGGSGEAAMLLAKVDKNGETVNLGPEDFSFTVPTRTGTIGMANANGLAGQAAASLLLLLEATETTLQLLQAAALGEPVSDFCSAGGGYTATFDPAPPLAAGHKFTVTFHGCDRSIAGGDADSFAGTFALVVESIAGAIDSDHALAAVVGPLDVTVSSPEGATSVGGILRCTRTVAGGTTSLTASALAQAALVVVEVEGSSTVRKEITGFAVSHSRADDGSYQLGAAGEEVRMATSTVAGSLTLRVLQGILGAAGNAPVSGAFSLTATDGSSVTARITNGDVELTVDTDGDGSSDGTTHVSWTDLE